MPPAQWRPPPQHLRAHTGVPTSRSLIQGKVKPQPLWTPPNILTFARVALVPVLVLLWHTPHRTASSATAIVFIAAAVTDWLDGYLARRVGAAGGPAHGGIMCEEAAGCVFSGVHITLASPPAVVLQLKISSAFGAFLDPVADKIMWVCGRPSAW